MVDVNVTPFEIEVRTRAGDLVRADVYLPGAGHHPVLLAASPYQKALRHLPGVSTFPFVEYGPMQLYLDNGYAYVAMDVPGTGRSEGRWDPVSRAEGEAIHDMIEHVAAQPWSTGAVGMIGMSYYCWSQWNAARTRPPHLRTIVAYDGATDAYRDWMYHGGIPIQGFLNAWLFGSVLYQHQLGGIDYRECNKHEFVYDALTHPFDDEWQRRRSPFWELDRVDIPVFSIGVWGKGPLHLRGNFYGYERVTGPKKLLVTHPDSFAAAQAYFFDEDFHRAELLPWYDHHLKDVDNAVMDGPDVRFHVNGEGVYREADAWPPADAEPTTFHLSGTRADAVTSLNDGSLTEAAPPPAPDSTSWSYPDPHWRAGVTVFDQTGRPDHVARVTTFTTTPMDRDREFTGHGMLDLYASSDQTDMDVIVKLTLVPGDARAPITVSRGWLRASHRAEDPELTSELRPFHAHQRAEPIEPGTVYRLRIELLPMSFLAATGDRIRLEISNNDSLVADAPMTHFYGRKVGTDTYHHDDVHPSALRLHERPRR
ncbi:CocE/NonD family hydrolase [Pseudonocardia acaciae]|uniref:CocE/NonD family hydrolase n=1 Tax=Pseudonocardia acaciae TaxID=551276 RepID=UPI00048FEBE9|nr:CocE/NonD family hydrolase [Pseudonocardia acaciae]